MTARRRARRHWVRRLLGLIVMVLLGWLVWVAATWPDVRALATQPPTTTAFIERYQERERAAGRTPRAEWRGGAPRPHPPPPQPPGPVARGHRLSPPHTLPPPHN